MRIAIVYICCCLVAGWFSLCFGQSASELYSEAVTERQHGRFQSSVGKLKQAVQDSSEYREASVLLAQMYLRDVGQPDEAERLIDSGLDRYPDDEDFESLDLLRRFRYPPRLLPNLHLVRITNRAKNLLEENPDDNSAHLVLGSLAADQYHSFRIGVSIPGVSENAFASVPMQSLEPVSPRGNRQNIEYESRGLGYENEVNSISKERFANEYYETAERHLEAALSADPFDKLAYRTLALLYAESRQFEELRDLATRMTRNRSFDEDGFLYSGLALYSLGEEAKAEQSFSNALALLPVQTRALFENINGILSDHQSKIYESDPDEFADTFWLFSDPRYLTRVNERRVEHYARMAYVDLRFGAMVSGRRGWETEPGQVIVRYGIPEAESLFSTATDTYYMIAYPEFGFRFMDLAKAGKFTFYSPKISGAPSFEDIRRAWNDDTIRSAERFRENPQISRYPELTRRVSFPFENYYFKSSRRGMTDMILSIGIPVDSFTVAEDYVRTGVFLLKDGTMTRSTIPTNIQAGSHTVVSHSVPAREGAGWLSIEFDTDDQPIGFERVPVMVPPFDRSMAISSLVIANLVEEMVEGDDTERLPNTFLRESHAISPSLVKVFERGAPLYLYFEIYNLRRAANGDRSFSVEAFLIEDRKERGTEHALRRLRRRNSGRGVAVSFDRTSQDAEQSIYLALDTANARLGAHIIAIRITDRLSGSSVYEAASVELR